MAVKRSKLLPFGGSPLSSETLQQLGDRIWKAVEHARSLHSVRMTTAAKQIWWRIYPTLSHGHPGMLGAVTARAEAQCLRLALAYALADAANAIDREHLLAAVAVWERSEASARHIFGAALGDRVADEILRAVTVAGTTGITRTDISRLFKGHEGVDRIGAALDLLMRRHRVERHQVPGENGGRPAEVWSVQNREGSETS